MCQIVKSHSQLMRKLWFPLSVSYYFWSEEPCSCSRDGMSEDPENRKHLYTSTGTRFVKGVLSVTGGTLCFGGFKRFFFKHVGKPHFIWCGIYRIHIHRVHGWMMDDGRTDGWIDRLIKSTSKFVLVYAYIQKCKNHIPILKRPLLSISINSYTSQQFGQPLLRGQKYDSATSLHKLRQNLTKNQANHLE